MRIFHRIDEAPEVTRVAHVLGVHPFHVVGALVRLWTYAACHSPHPHRWRLATPEAINNVLEFPGFIEALITIDLVRLANDGTIRLQKNRLIGIRVNRQPIPKKLRAFILERDHGVCRNCGATRHLQIDHVLPLSKGGTTTAENLQALCAGCNLEKSNHLRAAEASSQPRPKREPHRRVWAVDFNGRPLAWSQGRR